MISLSKTTDVKVASSPFLTKHYEGKLKKPSTLITPKAFQLTVWLNSSKTPLNARCQLKPLSTITFLKIPIGAPEFDYHPGLYRSNQSKGRRLFDCGPTDLCEYYRELLTNTSNSTMALKTYSKLNP